MKFSVNSLCPCDSSKKYKKCCQPFHKGKNPSNALLLMKSRYSAFAVGDINYIIKTSTFQKDFDDLKSFSDNCQFHNLKILEFVENKNEAYVTFEANITCENEDHSFIEKSKFNYIDAKWFYVGT